MPTRLGDLEVSYSSRGNPTYRLELWHDGLRKHRLIRGPDSGSLMRKAELQSEEWDAKWIAIEERAQDRRDRVGQKSLAAERSRDAKAELDRLEGVLRQTLLVNDVVEWDQLIDRAPFPEPPPAPPAVPAEPAPTARPREPKPEDPGYQPQLGFLGKLVASRRERIVAERQAAFESDRNLWKQKVRTIEADDEGMAASYEAQLRQTEKDYQDSVQSWEKRRTDYSERQRESNEAVARRREAYRAGATDAIVEYCDLVLHASKYPDYFPKEFELDYNPETKILIVDYALPAPSDLPTVKDVKYVASTGELQEQFLPSAASAKLYDDLLYKVALRTVHELLEADVVSAIDTVVFNGFVSSVDPRIGQVVTACVLSLSAQRKEFLAINLANVDAKACFKSLKGVGSSKLHSLAGVAPVMQIRREDGRFVSAREVANTLDESSNLAAMDWEDFEHLIREVFEKEFSASGGEVKVTQASRDGGVDAVAFDPDPIRGGKIVIQAKRYTNTVGVSAVRDLYGTLMNEGANKGILVTTSDYGPDAYAFAKGKPLVLLNGANLLHMLERHGHRVRIDVEEARRIAMSQNLA